MLDNDITFDNKENLFSLLANKFVPFWPLFLVLFILGIFSAWTYLLFATPQYAVDAALIITDEEKGVDDSKILESIDVFTSKKIVENEIEVLHSKELIKDVVYGLNLYAPIFESALFKNTSAYLTSPIRILLENPDNSIYYGDEAEKDIDFTFYDTTNAIQINEKNYPLNVWVENPFGGERIMFISNPNYKASHESKSYYFTFVHPKVMVNAISDNLTVNSSNKSSTVVRLNYEDAVTKRGEDIVNQIIKSYQAQSTKQRENLAVNTLAFVDNRIELVGVDLEAVEKELEKYKSSEGVVDISEQGSLYLNNVGDYDRRIGDIELQLAVLQKVQNYVVSKNKKAGIVPSTLGINDPLLSQLLDRLYEAELEYEELRKTTAENNPIIVAVKNRIDQIRPSILENVGSQRANLRASLGNLNSTNGKFNTALQLLPEQERKLVEITRKKKSITELFDFLAKKREEIALSYAPSQGDARVIETAESSLKPVRPKKLLVYFIAVLLATGIATLTAIGKELFSSKILFRSEMERYSDIPILGELAFLDKKDKELLVNSHKDVFIIDQFRHLLSAIGLYKRTNKIKTILITSSLAGEGKSYVSGNLAQTIAFSGKKVVLLDMDLRNAETTAIFGLNDKLGLTEYLTNKATAENIVNKSLCADLYVIPSGEKSIHSSELLGSRKLEELFDILYGTFDYIIIDTPPFTMVSDATILSDFSDTTLLVVRHDYTPKNMGKRIDEAIQSKRLKDCGIIFNSVKQRGFSNENYGYGNGYGYDVLYTKKSKSIIAETLDFLKPKLIIKNILRSLNLKEK